MIAKSEKWRYDGKCGCSVYEACPRCIGIYEQGKSDGRKQTLSEVLKDLDDDMKTGLNDNRFLINKYKQKLRELSK